MYQTKDEQREMYKKLSKKELIEMLISNNEVINNMVCYPKPEVPQGPTTSCDRCGRNPSVIYRTAKGTFCQEHAIF